MIGKKSLGHHTKSNVVVGVIGVVVVAVARPRVGSVVVPGTRAAQKPTTGTLSVCSLQPGAQKTPDLIELIGCVLDLVSTQQMHFVTVTQ